MLFRILRLWYCLCNKQQHRSPRRTYIYYLRYTPMRVRVYTYHRHLSVAMFCYFQRNLPDFRMPKQSALRRYLLCPVSLRTVGHLPDVDYKKCISYAVRLQNTPQNYNKKMTYANNMSLFFIFFVFLRKIAFLLCLPTLTEQSTDKASLYLRHVVISS